MTSSFQVWAHSGYSQSPSYADYDLCIQSVLPPDMIAEGYLGITAATGGLSDDHDVICFTLHSLVQKEAGPMSEAGLSKFDGTPRSTYIYHIQGII